MFERLLERRAANAGEVLRQYAAIEAGLAHGWQAALEDDQTAVMPYVDRDLGNWQDQTAQRRVNLYASLGGVAYNVMSGFEVESDSTSPTLRLNLDSRASVGAISEAWYDSKTTLGSIYYTWTGRNLASGDIGRIDGASNTVATSTTSGTDVVTGASGTGTATETSVSGYRFAIAILARAQGVPTLVAVGLPLAEVRDGVNVIVDAERGVLDIAPTAERIAAARAVIERQSVARAEVLALAHEKAETADGVRIEVAANIATAADAAEAVKLGAESVGLLRTELLFLERETAPNEAEQRAAYQAVIDGLDGRSAIIRTLDVGADKSLPYIPMPEEENPALGLRGIRLCLARQALLVEQLRAILAVQPLSAVKIMLPMVVDASEIVATRVVLDVAPTFAA